MLEGEKVRSPAEHGHSLVKVNVRLEGRWAAATRGEHLESRLFPVCCGSRSFPWAHEGCCPAGNSGCWYSLQRSWGTDVPCSGISLMPLHLLMGCLREFQGLLVPPDRVQQKNALENVELPGSRMKGEQRRDSLPCAGHRTPRCPRLRRFTRTPRLFCCRPRPVFFPPPVPALSRCTNSARVRARLLPPPVAAESRARLAVKAEQHTTRLPNQRW